MNKFLSYQRLFVIVIIFLAIFVSIGYASIQSISLDIESNATVTSPQEVFIYDAYFINSLNTNGEESVILNYVDTILQSRVVLNDDVSSNLTLVISIRNNSNKTVYFDKVYFGSDFYDNENIDFVVNGINRKDMLEAYSTITFSITFKYTDQYINTNPSGILDHTLNSYLNFRFVDGYTITYTNITIQNNYPTLILEKDDLSVIFFEDIPQNIRVIGMSSNAEYVNGVDYTYLNNTLVFNNVNEDLEIQKVNTINYVVNNSNVYDHTILESNSITIFPNVEGIPKVETNNDGKVIKFEYTSAPVLYITGSALDTGVDVFDMNGYTIHMVYKINTLSNAQKYIFSALSKTNGQKYKGLLLSVYSQNKFNMYASNVGANYKQFPWGTLITSNGWNVEAVLQTYTFDMTYIPPLNKAISASLIPVSSGNSSYTASSNNLSYYPDSISDCSLVIGGSLIDTSRDVVNMEVLELVIEKKEGY